MSIVLKDGTVLPDLPADVLAEHPYFFIEVSETLEYMAFASEKPLVVIPGSLIAPDAPYDCFAIQAGLLAMMQFQSEKGWVLLFSTENEMPSVYMDGSAYDAISWTNHDIYFLETFNLDDFSYTIGTEVAIPSSVSKPPFVLPDGTELPALPDGCFDGTPYGMVVKVIEDGTTLYVFGAGSSAGFVVPAAIENSEYDMLRSLGESISYVHAPGQIDGWEDNGTNGMNDPLIDGVLEVAWSNYDLLKATAKNADGSYTIGTEIARKSDENYRVTGGYMTSIANEARRLGGVAGEMKPDVLESTLRGVTGGGNLPNAEDMVFGSDGSSSEYGIFLKDDSPISTSSNNGTMGWAFTVLDDIVVKGLRYYSPGNAIDKSRIVRLWSGDGREVLVEYSAPNDSITDPSGWVEHVLETPLTLEAGKTYNLSVYSTVRIARTAVENVTLNPKIQYVRYWFVDNEHMFDFGSSDYKDTVVLCDFVADTDDAGENVNQPCIIQSDRMDDIADEANRIVGKSGKISPAQIVSALKSVTAGGGGDIQLPDNAKMYYFGTAESVLSSSSFSFEAAAVGTTLSS